MVREDFAGQVREALAHLHSRSHLEALPLAVALGEGGRRLSGDALRLQLLDAIEQLKPAQTTPATLADGRRYRHLILRYVEGYSRDQVARDLMVSARQASRDHEQAIHALAAILRRRRPGRPDAGIIGETVSRSSREDARPRPALESAVDPSETDGNLAETLRGALATLQKLLDDRRVRVELSLPDILPTVAVGRGLLRQALLHLLSFAAEVARGGTVSLSAADVAEGIVLGIRIAGAPSQPPATPRPPGELAKVKDLFDVGSRLLGDRGISVRVEGEVDRPGGLIVVLPPTQQSKVLIVDDNPDVVELFRRYLRGRPYRLVQATTGASALRVAAELQPDVIILDVMLPSQDGWDVLHDLRAIVGLRETPVIVCSVLPERSLAEELGVTDFLLKPVTRPSLLAALDRWCPPPGARPARL